MLRTVPISFSFFRRGSRTCPADSHYALGVTLLFFAVSGFTAVHHEMWRDEIQAWLLARDSASVFELFASLKYEGHPGLWHLFLMPLTRLTASPVVMQAFHLLIAGGTVYLFVRYAPFNRLQKFLFSFGYFPLYEYAVIARNYALGFLLLTLLCVLFKERSQRPMGIGCVLLLLAHTSVYGLIVTVAIGGALFCEVLWFRARGAAWQAPPTRKKKMSTAERDVQPMVDVGRRVWFGFALIGLGIFTAVVQLNPPSDSSIEPWVSWVLTALELKDARNYFDLDRLTKVMHDVSRAFLPIPTPLLNFWNSHHLETFPLFQAIQLPLSVVFLLCGVLPVRKRPTALLIYLASMLGLLAFSYLVYYTSTARYHGFLFMTFLMAAWISRDCPEIHVVEGKERKARAARKSAWAGSTAWPRTFSTLLTVILVCQCIGGIIAVRMERLHVFSFGKQTAEFIKTHGLQDLPMVGDFDIPVVTVVGYLQKDHVYYVQGNRLGSFIRQDHDRSDSRVHVVDDRFVIDFSDVLNAAKTFHTDTSQDVLLILNYPLNAAFVERLRLTSLAHFAGSVVGDENFYLYLMR